MTENAYDAFGANTNETVIGVAGTNTIKEENEEKTFKVRSIEADFTLYGREVGVGQRRNLV